MGDPLAEGDITREAYKRVVADPEPIMVAADAIVSQEEMVRVSRGTNAGLEKLVSDTVDKLVSGFESSQPASLDSPVPRDRLEKVIALTGYMVHLGKRRSTRNARQIELYDGKTDTSRSLALSLGLTANHLNVASRILGTVADRVESSGRVASSVEGGKPGVASPVGRGGR
jgi:hypothetical protein